MKRMWGKKRSNSTWYYLGIPLALLAGYQIYKNADKVQGMVMQGKDSRRRQGSSYEDLDDKY